MQITNRDTFIESAKAKHGMFYNYDKFVYIKSVHKSIIICPIHGDFLKSANKHLYGQGCPLCSNKKSGVRHTNTYHKGMQKKLNDICKDKYDISETIFGKAKSIIKVKCIQHGEFEINQYQFLHGIEGCLECRHIKASEKATGFSSELYLRKHKRTGEIPYLYILILSNDSEKFIKIGITYNLDSRYKGSPYLIDKYLVIDKLSPQSTFDVEKYMKRGFKEFFKEYRYKPLIKFGGHTECYTLDVIPLLFKSGLNMLNNINDTLQMKIQILKSAEDLLLHKNKMYGDSALLPINIFSKNNSEVGILQRMDDKLNRCKTTDKLRKNDIVDLLCYGLLLYSQRISD